MVLCRIRSYAMIPTVQSSLLQKQKISDVKLEYLNVGGSLDDRAAIAIVEVFSLKMKIFSI